MREIERERACAYRVLARGEESGESGEEQEEEHGGDENPVGEGAPEAAGPSERRPSSASRRGCHFS